jgi:excisionase family DNA binding protein
MDTGKNEEISKLLTLKEACEILKVHPNTLRQWDNKGILKAVRIGVKKVRRYKKEDIETFINKGSNKHI